MGQKSRYLFVDQLRGMIMAFMGLDHASDYFNSVWKRVSYDNYLFDSFGQFIIRYLSYLCAPGFLMLAGAMVWLSFDKRRKDGAEPWSVRRSLMLRGAFLILVQITWVNASWGGFSRIRLDHFGIIASIGTSIILLTLIVQLAWRMRLALAAGILLIHPLLLAIPYDKEAMTLTTRLMQMFIDSGKWNLYPVLPGFALCILGSVAGEAWFVHWKDDRRRLRNTLVAGLAGLVGFFIVRAVGGYGNIFPYEQVGSIAFFFIQKYPPSLAHSFLFPGLIMLCAALFMAAGGRLRVLLHPLEIYGRTPFFFYVIHIPLMAVLTRRLGLLPHQEGDVGTALVAWVGLLIVMYPLCRWFGGMKARTTNPLIRMM